MFQSISEKTLTNHPLVMKLKFRRKNENPPNVINVELASVKWKLMSAKLGVYNMSQSI